MPLYRFDNSPVIDKVTVITNASGGSRAYLHAKPDASPELLGETMKTLLDKGYLAVPFEVEGKPVLELRGFGKKELLLETLQANNLTQGKAKTHEIPEDKISLLSKLKKNSFMVSALLYLVGDLSFIYYEKQRDKKSNEDKSHDSKRGVWDWLAGYGYLAGTTTSIASMLLSSDASEEQISKAANMVVQASQRAGIELPNDNALLVAAKGKEQNPLVSSFTKHSSELMNIGFATAGVAIAQNNLQKLRDLNEKELQPGFEANDFHKASKTEHKMDIALGMISTASGLTSVFVKEKPRDPSQPRKKGVAGVGEFFQEKPLRIAGYGYLLSTVIHLVSSLKERSKIVADNKANNENKSVEHTTFRLIFVVTNLIAEVIMSLSSKGHGAGVKSDDSVDPTTCAMVADMIHKKPADMRDDLVERMSEFLSMPDALGTNQDKLKSMINDQLAKLDKNPWVNNVQKAKPTPVEIADNNPLPKREIKPHPRIKSTAVEGLGLT